MCLEIAPFSRADQKEQMLSWEHVGNSLHTQLSYGLSCTALPLRDIMKAVPGVSGKSKGKAKLSALPLTFSMP